LREFLEESDTGYWDGTTWWDESIDKFYFTTWGPVSQALIDLIEGGGHCGCLGLGADQYKPRSIGEEDITLEQFKATKEQAKLDNAQEAVEVAVYDLKHDEKIAVLRAVLGDLEKAELAA
jgi:hypothetical protein